jgi:hypothetical protein
MAVRRLWKPFAAAALFILVMFYVMSVKPIREGFDSIASLLSNLQMAQNQNTVVNSYDQWVGNIYKQPDVSAKALNDFKSRFFQPNCAFRRDWSNNVSNGLQRLQGSDTSQLANVAYKTFLDCLADGNQKCIEKLADAKARFMVDGCDFLNPSDIKSYNRNYSPVFKQ